MRDGSPSQTAALCAFAAALASLIAGVLVWQGYSAWLHTGTVSIPGDADPYMRYLRVLELLRTGDWLGVAIPGAHLGGADLLLWTRPLDVLIVALAWPLSPAMPLREAVLLGGSLVSPLLLVCAAPLIVLALRELDVHPFGVLSVLLAFVLHPLILAEFRFGRGDHHALLLLCLVAFTASFLRALARADRSRAYEFAGAVAGLGVWIHPEFTLFAAVAAAILAFSWWLGDGAAAARLQRYGLGALAVVAFASLVEHGAAGLSAVEHDRVSLVHVALFTSLAAVGWLLERSNDLFRTPLMRGLALCAFSLCGLVLLQIWLPGFYLGPARAMDPELYAAWFQRLEQSQGLFSVASAREVLLVLAMAGYSVATCLYGRRGADPTRRAQLDFVLLSVLASFCLTLAFTRWAFFLSLLCLLPLGILGTRLWRSFEPASPWLRVAALQAFVLLAVVAPYLAAGTAAPQEGASARRASAASCDRVLARWIQQDRIAAWSGLERAFLLTRSNDAPAVLFWTRHRVLAWNNHRSARGLLLQERFFQAASETELREVVDQAPVDLILYCPKQGERGEQEPYWSREDPRPLPSWLEVIAGDRSGPGPVLLRVTRVERV